MSDDEYRPDDVLDDWEDAAEEEERKEQERVRLEEERESRKQQKTVETVMRETRKREDAEQAAAESAVISDKVREIYEAQTQQAMRLNDAADLGRGVVPTSLSMWNMPGTPSEFSALAKNMSANVDKKVQQAHRRQFLEKFTSYLTGNLTVEQLETILQLTDSVKSTVVDGNAPRKDALDDVEDRGGAVTVKDELDW